MTSRRLPVLVALTVPALILAGCAGSPDESVGDDPGGTVAAPAPDSGTSDTADSDSNDSDSSETGGAGSGTATSDVDESSAPPSGTTDGPVEITIAASGDVLAHSWVNASARMYAGYPEADMWPVDGADYDYSPMFAEISDLVSSADLSLCHMETPLSLTNSNLSVPNTLSFNTPPQIATALADAGYDGCDFASNHTLDRGLSGLDETEQVLRDAGMGFAGPTAHEDRAGLADMYDVQAEGGAVQVAHLAYTYTYPNSGTPTTHIPGEAPWLVEASWPNIGSEGILEQAGAAKDDGADFVVVSMHWGNEYQAQPTEDQRQIASALLESDDVDLILGTHVHVIQPCEEINGKHVIYGLGNSLSNQSPTTASSLIPATQEGMVAMFTLSRDDAGEVTTSMRYQPTRVLIPPNRAAGHIIEPVSPENYPETWERTTSTVDLLGGCGAEPIDPDQG